MRKQGLIYLPAWNTNWMGKKNAHLLLLYTFGEKKKKFYFGHSSAIVSTKKNEWEWMRKQENEWEWCPSIFVYTTIGQNRIQKIIRMNGKLEEQILHTQKRQQILQPWTYITENPEIVLQKTKKQREKLTDSSSDSSSDRISPSQLFSFSVLLVFLQCIFLSTVLW